MYLCGLCDSDRSGCPARRTALAMSLETPRLAGEASSTGIERRGTMPIVRIVHAGGQTRVETVFEIMTVGQLKREIAARLSLRCEPSRVLLWASPEAAASGRSAGHPGGAAADAPSTWACPVCTLVNQLGEETRQQHYATPPAAPAPLRVTWTVSEAAAARTLRLTAPTPALQAQRSAVLANPLSRRPPPFSPPHPLPRRAILSMSR